MDKTPNKK